MENLEKIKALFKRRDLEKKVMEKAAKKFEATTAVLANKLAPFHVGDRIKDSAEDVWEIAKVGFLYEPSQTDNQPPYQFTYKAYSVRNDDTLSCIFSNLTSAERLKLVSKYHP